MSAEEKREAAAGSRREDSDAKGLEPWHLACEDMQTQTAVQEPAPPPAPCGRRRRRRSEPATTSTESAPQNPTLGASSNREAIRRRASAESQADADELLKTLIASGQMPTVARARRRSTGSPAAGESEAPSIPVGSSPRLPAKPGAHRMYPFGHNHLSTATIEIGSSSEHSDDPLELSPPPEDRNTHGLAPAHREALDLERGLAEALAVDSIRISSMEHADPAQGTEKDKRGIYKKRYFFFFGIIILGVIALATFLSVSKSSSSLDNGDMEPANSTSTPETNTTNNGQVASEDANLREAMLARLPNFTRNAIETDHNGDTPQAKALEWILGDPLLANYTDKRFLQRYGAATFYYATDGPNWKHQGDENVTIMLGDSSSSRMTDIAAEGPWLSRDVHECNWFWTSPGAPVCTSDGVFLDLELSNNNLGGTLPPEVALWEDVRQIRFGHHHMEGSIPTEVGLLSRLESLLLVGGDLTGTIPTEVLKLSGLQELALNGNSKLRGNFVRDTWQLTNLRNLRASRTGFLGSLPESIGYQFPQMENLVLAQVDFTGSIPESIGQWSNLKQFMMYDEPMMISGTIPTFFGSLTRLEKLKIGSPLLSGTIPTELGRLTVLEDLLFRHSPSLMGALPSELGLLHGALKSLILVNTSVTGTIPEALCGIITLEFDCSPPKLCGCDCLC